MWSCNRLRAPGEPLYATTRTEGDHFSNSNAQLDKVLHLKRRERNLKRVDKTQTENFEGNTYDRGTIIKNGPFTRFFSIKQVISPMVCIVFPKPISSAKIPFKLLLYSDTNHSKPWKLRKAVQNSHLLNRKRKFQKFFGKKLYVRKSRNFTDKIILFQTNFNSTSISNIQVIFLETQPKRIIRQNMLYSIFLKLFDVSTFLLLFITSL